MPVIVTIGRSCISLVKKLNPPNNDERRYGLYYYHYVAERLEASSIRPVVVEEASAVFKTERCIGLMLQMDAMTENSLL